MELIFAKKYRSVRHLVLLLAIGFCFLFLLSYGSTDNQYVLIFSVGMTPITLVTCYVFIYRLIPALLLKDKLLQFITWSIATLLGSVVLTLTFLITLVGYLPNLTADQMPPSSKNYPFLLTTMFVIVLLVSFMSLWKQRQSIVIDNLKLARELAESEVAMKKQALALLKNQLHPHFLFNSLNTIYSLALTKSKETPETILKLSDLLDYILYQVDQHTVSLKKELSHMSNYIDLEETRFDDTLKVTFQTDVDREDYEVAPMLFMPFVENAFKHGKVISVDQLVDIKLTISNDLLNFSIRNSCLDKPINYGIGLENIVQRLAMLYPERHTLTIDAKENLFEVNLEIRGLKPKMHG